MIRSKRLLKDLGELLLFSLFIGAINIIFVHNPGFFKGIFNPYLLLAFVVAAYYGKNYGFLSLSFSALVILLPLPLVLGLFRHVPWGRPYWTGLGSQGLITLAVALVGVYVFGLIKESSASTVRQAKERLRTMSRAKGLLQRQSRVLKLVNHELEERVSRQQDSVTELHSRIQELYSLNLQKAFEAILETVQKFSSANSASIWELDPDAKNLRMAASIGWEGEHQTVIPVESSIEGWVIRNDTLFSIRMLLQHENLRNMDKGRNLLTLPMYSGRKIWGVLNIEDMPFVKYNHYTERLLLMIMALAGPALERAIEYEAIVSQGEVNEYTGFPPYSQFYSSLKKTMQRLHMENGTLSVIIVELINFDDLAAEYGKEALYGLIVEMSQEMMRLSQNKASFFHYKDESQIVLICQNLDFDGTSLLSLETLGMINEKDWRLKDQSVSLDLILGYAAMGGKKMDADEILQVAENILDMQKV